MFRLQNTADKINLIRLNRELRDYKERAEILRFESDKHKSVLFLLTRYSKSDYNRNVFRNSTNFKQLMTI